MIAIIGGIKASCVYPKDDVGPMTLIADFGEKGVVESLMSDPLALEDMDTLVVEHAQFALDSRDNSRRCGEICDWLTSLIGINIFILTREVGMIHKRLIDAAAVKFDFNHSG